MAQRLDPADCPFARENWAAALKVDCRWLVVPHDRTVAGGPSGRLFVVVIHADAPSDKPPLVMLHGGPAQSTLTPMLRGAARRPVRDRVTVIYDQRGAGSSNPDPCPAYAKRLDQLAARGDALETVARECVTNMRALGIDPATFSTAGNAADLIDLRKALGYERWDVYGASYGATLALEAMRRDPRGIRAAVLENPAPTGPESAEAPLATQYALQRLFAACERSTACHSAFPALGATFLAVFDTLARSPVVVPPADSTAKGMVLDSSSFGEATRRLLRSRQGVARLPLILRELQRGDRARAAREMAGLAASAARPSRAAFWLVRCYDQYGPAHQRHFDSVRAVAWRPLRGLRDNREVCSHWQARFAPLHDGTAVVSDVPTLILTGELDPVTPIEFGRRIASTLSQSFLFELPGETHGGQPTGCRATILAQFLANPERKPDDSCVVRMPPVEFVTHWP